jgi:hypothetical protein
MRFYPASRFIGLRLEFSNISDFLHAQAVV